MTKRALTAAMLLLRCTAAPCDDTLELCTLPPPQDAGRAAVKYSWALPARQPTATALLSPGAGGGTGGSGGGTGGAGGGGAPLPDAGRDAGNPGPCLDAGQVNCVCNYTGGDYCNDGGTCDFQSGLCRSCGYADGAPCCTGGSPWTPAPPYTCFSGRTCLANPSQQLVCSSGPVGCDGGTTAGNAGQSCYLSLCCPGLRCNSASTCTP